MNAIARNILVVAGLLLALGTVFGAVGTHALRARLSPDQLERFRDRRPLSLLQRAGIARDRRGGAVA